jgi:hypothetical protein
MCNYAITVLKEAPRRQDAWKNGSTIPHIWLALGGREWLASRSDRFIPEDTAPDACRLEGWMGLRNGLDAVAERKFLSLPEIELRPSRS